MQVLRFATRQHIESVFSENHDLWGLPLAPDQYRDYWFSLFRTPWASSNLRYMALTDEEEGPLQSTLKLYRFTGSLYGEPLVIAGIGALYTPKTQRTFGAASLLLSEVLDYMQKKKAAAALLYSDIGRPFYERLGFRALPVTEVGGPLPSPATAPILRTPPGIEIRAVRPEDAPALVPYHRAVIEHRPLSLERDSAYWEFILFRRRRFWEMAPPSSGRAVSLVVLDRGKIVAAGFATIGSRILRIEEIGAIPGSEEALVGLLDRIWAAAAEEGAVGWRGSLPPGLERLDPRLRGDPCEVLKGIPMVAELAAGIDLDRLSADPAHYLYRLDAI